MILHDFLTCSQLLCGKCYAACLLRNDVTSYPVTTATRTILTVHRNNVSNCLSKEVQNQTKLIVLHKNRKFSHSFLMSSNSKKHTVFFIASIFFVIVAPHLYCAMRMRLLLFSLSCLLRICVCACNQGTYNHTHFRLF